MSETTTKSWLERKHPYYEKVIERVRYARDVYTGDLLNSDRIAAYLKQRSQGEADESFEERRDLADFSNFFGATVDRFVGMLANVEGDANRIYKKKDTTFGLGDPDDRSTPIGRLMQEADANGRGLLSVMDLVATELSVAHWCWILASSSGRGDARATVIPFERVPNWRVDGNGQLQEVLVEQDVDARSSLQDDAGALRQFMYYKLLPDGRGTWQSWQLDEKSKAETMLAEGFYKLIAPGEQPALPIWAAVLPLTRMAGYLMARKNVVLFNQESTRDHLLRVCGFPKFSFAGTRDAFDKAKADFRKGVNMVHQPNDSEHAHQYLAPPSEPATVMNAVLQEKRETFFLTASQEYSNSVPRERTATEASQSVGMGAGAYLHHLANAVDNAENGFYWRVEQLVYPNDRRNWYVSHVSRSENFMPSDPGQVAETQAKRAFGEKPAPMGLAALVAAAADVARLQGLTIDQEQLTAHVQAGMLVDAFAVMPGLPAPAPVRAQILTLVLTAAGVAIDEKVKAAIEKFATNEDLLKEREAQTFSDPPADPNKPQPTPGGDPAGGGAL